jgi:hypothetical protein
VASHFDAAGQVNGWQSREAFCGMYAGIVALLTLLFLLAPLFMGLLSDARLNLPNKDYWLAPERRAQSRAWLADWGFLSGAMTMAFLIGVMRLVSEANAGPRTALSPVMIWLVVGFAVGQVVLLVVLLAKFGRRPA